jgi:hypothetical protein
VAAFNQVGRDLNQTVNVYAGVPLTDTLQQLLYQPIAQARTCSKVYTVTCLRRFLRGARFET